MHRIALLIDRGRDAVTGRGLGRALFDGDHGLVFYYASTATPQVNWEVATCPLC